MSCMKNILSLALAAALVVTVARAEPPADTGNPLAASSNQKPAKKDMVSKLKDKLGLTDDQATKVSGILKEQAETGRAIRQDTSLNNDQKKAKMAEIRKAGNDKINAILTPEQQAKWAEAKKNRGEGKKKGCDSAGGGNCGKNKTKSDSAN